jgi:hypothetical protein
MSNLIVGDISLDLVEAPQPLVSRIKRQDRSLANQRASGEQHHFEYCGVRPFGPGTKRSRLFSAAGSANETRAALRLAVGWRYCAREDAASAEQLLDRVIAMLWKLTR